MGSLRNITNKQLVGKWNVARVSVYMVFFAVIDVGVYIKYKHFMSDYSDFMALNELFREPAYSKYITQVAWLHPEDVSFVQRIVGMIGGEKQSQTIQLIEGHEFRLPDNKSEAMRLLLHSMVEVLDMPPERADDEVLERLNNTYIRCQALDDHFIYRYNFALMNLRLGNIENGVALLENTIETNPNVLGAHSSLAIIYTFGRKWEKGAYHAMRVLQDNLADWHCSLLLMNCLITCTFRMGRYDQCPISLQALKEDGRCLDQMMDFLPILEPSAFDHTDHDKPIIFVFCDGKYFTRHSVNLILSICDTNDDVVIHVHIVNADDAEKVVAESLKEKIPLKLVTSYEYVNIDNYPSGMPPANDKIYYSCVRFFRLYQMVMVNKNTIIMSDADVVFRKNIKELPEVFDETYKMGLVSHDAPQLWEKITALFSFFKQSKETESYLRIVSAIILDNMKNQTSYWFLDQFALSLTYETLENHDAIKLYKAPLLNDLNCSDDAVTWALVNHEEDPEKFTEYVKYLREKYQIH
jgi:hypothetical protein